MRFLLQPNDSLLPFKVGATISNTIRILRDKYSNHHVKVIYSDEHTLETDIILEIPNFGIRLHFDSISQRLWLIDIFDLHQSHIEYNGAVFSGVDATATFPLIYQTFGPTTLGIIDIERKTYLLKYHGVAFVFPIVDPVPSGQDFPSELSNPPGRQVSRILIYHGTDPMRLSLPKPDYLSYFEPVEAHIGRGLFFTIRNSWLNFGSTPQDIILELGPPSSYFYKRQNKMLLQSNLDDRNSLAHDYCLNYFLLGIDFLFGGLTHKLKKIILHSNLPCRFDFNRYNKCNFTLVIPSISSPIVNNNLNLQENHLTHISVDTPWKNIQEQIGHFSAPLVCGNSTIPFGPSLLYALKGLWIEVAPNGFIASLGLFSY